MHKDYYIIRTYDRDIFITEEDKLEIIDAINKGIEYLNFNDILIVVRRIKEIVPSDLVT